MKKMDIIIIAFLLVISFVPAAVFGVLYNRNSDSIYAEITISGELYKTVPLASHKGEDSFVISNKYGENTIEVKEHAIGITHADCTDELCVQTGFIAKPGETIICLPHQLMIEIKGTTDNSSIIDGVAQ